MPRRQKRTNWSRITETEMGYLSKFSRPNLKGKVMVYGVVGGNIFMFTFKYQELTKSLNDSGGCYVGIYLQ